ncbi:MAG: hypothetical protein ACTHN5_03700 [Phycisphaerae bacterium]
MPSLAKSLVPTACACLLTCAFANLSALSARAEKPHAGSEAHLALQDLKDARNLLNHDDMKAARANLKSAKDHLKQAPKSDHQKEAMKFLNNAIDAADHSRPKITLENIEKAIAEVEAIK